MCGITGIVNFTAQKPSFAIISQMNDALSYRGPNDTGIDIVTHCALGNRRLSVIDLSKRAHQPLWDYKRTHCITFNGEIYNYVSLRNILEKKGYRFLSDSDTEVIVNAYKEYGERAVEKLEGMFAFAIWDARKEELFLARDQFGIKPLHYYVDTEVFIFASEIKSILIHPNVRKIINPIALSHYFSLGFGCIASPQTIFSSIYKLPPGHMATVAEKSIRIDKYYNDLENTRSVTVSHDEAIEKTRTLLSQSVAGQMVSDVPLGVFLSGGIDSSLIASLAQRNSTTPVKTFSIGFGDTQFDESTYAQKVALYLKTDHHTQVFGTKDLLEIIPLVVGKLDEPLGDPSILPTFLLSAMTRRHVTVALSGDGGDELFAGYPTYIAHAFADRLENVPPSLLNSLRTISSKLEFMTHMFPFMRHASTVSTQEKLDRFFAGIHQNKALQYVNFMGPLPLHDKNQLLLEHKESALQLVEKLLVRVQHLDRQTQIQYLDLMIYLAEDCLVKTDRASSYNSLEVRVPFLDTHLVSYVFSLPSSYRMRALTLKYLLKRVAKGLVPDEIIHRPKKGFGIPVESLLRGELKTMLLSYLSKQKLKKQGLFHISYIEKLTSEHLSGVSNHGRALWSILMFQLWYEKWYGQL